MTLKILVIDDSSDKIREIASVLRSQVSDSEIAISTAGDLYNAQMLMQAGAFDIVVLDVNMPARAGDEVSPDACEIFLREISRNQRIKEPGYLVGLTAFGDLYERLYPIFAASGWLLFNFDSQRDTWPKVLAERVKYARESSREQPDREYFTDVAVVAALATPELASVLEWPVEWITSKPQNDYVEYRRASLTTASGQLSIVAASCQHMGFVPSTTLTLKTCLAFRPKMVVMVGIAAGVKGRTNLGDVLIAEESWDYNSGKLGRVRDTPLFTPDPKSIRISPEMCQIFQDPKRNEDWMHTAYTKWRGKTPADRPAIRLGPVASGSSVIADVDKVREIARHNRKLVGLEMETYGVYFAAENAWLPKPEFVSMKAVCDFADSKKKDAFQAYASHMSAQLLFELLTKDAFSDVLSCRHGSSSQVGNGNSLKTQ